MEIDLDLYKTFMSVATNGSISKASVELSVTQSAVSQSILKLEKIFGKELFVRSKQGVTLTSFGKQLMELVSDSISKLDLVYEKLLSEKKNVKTIKIGVSGTIASRLIIPTVKNYFSNTHLYIESLMTDKQKILAVENGELDFAIINDYNLPTGSNIYKRKLLSLEYGFFYNSEKLDVTEDNVFDQTLIIKNAGTKGRVEFNKKFYELVFKFSNTMEFSHDETIISAVEEGLGIGFCPKQYCPKNLTEINLSDKRVIKNIVLIYEQPSNEIDTFINEIENNFNS